MATMPQIRNPLEWGWDQLKQAQLAVEATGQAIGGADDVAAEMPQMIRRIGMADLRLALQQGMSEFAACRTDVVFLGLAYALAGIVLVHLTVGHDLRPLVFPLASGFAIRGPGAAVGLSGVRRPRARARGP